MMNRVSVGLKKEELKHLDELRGERTRSAFLRLLLESYYLQIKKGESMQRQVDKIIEEKLFSDNSENLKNWGLIVS